MSMGHILVVAGLAVVGVGVWFTRLIVQEIVRNEYRGWAPVAARFLVRVACRVRPGMAEEWESELWAAQDAGESGLVFAISGLVGSWWYASGWIGRWRRRRQVAFLAWKADLILRAVDEVFSAIVVTAMDVETVTVEMDGEHTTVPRGEWEGLREKMDRYSSHRAAMGSVQPRWWWYLRARGERKLARAGYEMRDRSKPAAGSMAGER